MKTTTEHSNTLSIWLAACIILSGALAFGQEAKGLSESDIVRLHAAGLSDATIIQQIQHDGLSFQTDANTTIRLKAAGISENVIKALLGGGNVSARPSSNSEIFSQTKVLYEEKQYGKLAAGKGSLVFDDDHAFAFLEGSDFAGLEKLVGAV